MPPPSRRRKKVRARIVIAPSRFLSTLTVMFSTSLAPSPSLDGRLEACSLSVLVMSYSSFSPRNCSLFSAQLSKSLT
jgi:hypothetical protein